MTPTIEVAIDSLNFIGQDLSWVGDGMAEIKGELASLNLRNMNYVKALRFRQSGYEIVTGANFRAGDSHGGRVLTQWADELWPR